MFLLRLQGTLLLSEVNAVIEIAISVKCCALKLKIIENASTSTPVSAKLPIALTGADANGRNHLELKLPHTEVQLMTVVDSIPEARLSPEFS